MADYVWAQTARILGQERTAGTDANEVELLSTRAIERYLDRGWIAPKQSTDTSGLVTDEELDEALDGLGSGALTLIERKTLTVAGALDFADIPQAYQDLVLEVHLRGAGAFNLGNLALRFNGDSGANYHWAYLYSSTSAAQAGGAASQTSLIVGRVPGASATATVFTDAKVTLPAYRSSTHKLARSEFGLFPSNTPSDFEVGGFYGRWGNVAAITALSVVPPLGTTYAIGSVASLYGVS